MDEGFSKAVIHVFVTLHEQGLMYRATRLINWCPECMTSLSDLEVDNEEGANGELFEFAYEVEGGGVAGWVFAEVRGKWLPVTVSELPFVTPHYKRR